VSLAWIKKAHRKLIARGLEGPNSGFGETGGRELTEPLAHKTHPTRRGSSAIC